MLSNNELMLFHGTNKLFDEVDLEKSKNKRDFGKGFYPIASSRNTPTYTSLR